MVVADYPFVIDYRWDGTILGEQSATRNKEVNILPIDAQNSTGVFPLERKVPVSRALTVTLERKARPAMPYFHMK